MSSVVPGSKGDSAPPFGALSPPGWLQRLIRLGHNYKNRAIASIAKRLAIKRGLPMDITVAGIKLRCRFVDNYSERKFVFTPWRYDVDERRLLERELPSDGVFVDIGANIGLYTLTVNQVLGPRGRIMAFEPNPVTMRRLRFNLAANRTDNGEQPNIELLDIGVADRDSSFELYAHHTNLGSYSIAGKNRAELQGHDEIKETLVIHCRPLLDVLKEFNIGHIDALKIDIEGAEDIALAPYLDNAPDDLLAKTIIIENSEALWGCDLFGKMERRGYSLRCRTKMNSVFSVGKQG